MYRTNNCGELRITDENKMVKIGGKKNVKSYVN